MDICIKTGITERILEEFFGKILNFYQIFIKHKYKEVKIIVVIINHGPKSTRFPLADIVPPKI